MGEYFVIGEPSSWSRVGAERAEIYVRFHILTVDSSVKLINIWS